MPTNTFKSAFLNFHLVGLLLSLKFIFSAQKFAIFNFLAILCSVFIIFLLYRLTIQYRDTNKNGSIRFGEAFNYIFLLYLMGSVVSSIVIFIFTQFINKEFLDISFGAIMKLYESMRIQIDSLTYNYFEKVFKPFPYSVVNLISSIFTAAFWALILANFAKKEKSIFEE